MNTHQNQPYLQNLSTQVVHMLSDTVIIGRHQDCNLVLKSERGASRKHARITVQNGSVLLMDLGSLNGTLVNGREINQAVQLSDGDVVIFDEQEYRFASAITSSQSSSDNVTIIANKDEIGRPDRIKPAIRLVETAPVTSSSDASADETDQASLDETKAWDSLTVDVEPVQDEQELITGQREAAVPLTQPANDHLKSEPLLTQPQVSEPQAQQQPAQEPQAQDAQSIPAPAAANEQPAADGDEFDWLTDESPTGNAPRQRQQPANHRQEHMTDQRYIQSSPDQHIAQNADYYDDQYDEIRATSRPGGNERSSRPGLQKHHGYHRAPTRNINWFRWLVVFPLLIAVAAGAIYLAYNAGYTAGSAGSSSGFS